MYVGDPDADEALWIQGRQPLFHYINRMGDFYWNMLANNGYEEEVTASRKAWQSRDREGAMDAISKRMVRDIQVIGTPEEVRDQLRKRAKNGADVQLIPMPMGTLVQVSEKLRSFIG